MTTVREATYDLLRALGMTTVFGNPGSTEEPFLQEFPDDFTYVLALQEASAVGIADGYAQATGRPAHVNLHTTPGTGNGMGNLTTAWHNKTPLIITAGQQTRMMSLAEPLLTNLQPPSIREPYVKWSHEPARAQDVPAAVMRAYATAIQPPAGPVYLSLPLDDWNQPADGPPTVREVTTRTAPAPDRIRRFADILAASRTPMLVIGGGVDRSGGWTDAIRLAERLRAPVWAPPVAERVGFPEDHPQFQGTLPPAIGPLSEKLSGHDVVLVVGAPIFRYDPYVPGSYAPAETRLLHITDDPAEAARAPVGDSLLADAALACASLTDLLPPADRPLPSPLAEARPPDEDPYTPLSPDELFTTLATGWPADGILVQESPSNRGPLRHHLRVTRPASYFAAASGGTGFGLPAAVGVALGERHTGRTRPVVAVIGDGSFQYSVQALWTAAQLRLPVVVVVPVNHEYAVLKASAIFGKLPGVPAPALDLPGLDIPTIARGFGCQGQGIASVDMLGDAFHSALQAAGPTVLAVPITARIPALL